MYPLNDVAGSALRPNRQRFRHDMLSMQFRFAAAIDTPPFRFDKLPVLPCYLRPGHNAALEFSERLFNKAVMLLLSLFPISRGKRPARHNFSVLIKNQIPNCINIPIRHDLIAYRNLSLSSTINLKRNKSFHFTTFEFSLFPSLFTTFLLSFAPLFCFSSCHFRFRFFHRSIL